MQKAIIGVLGRIYIDRETSIYNYDKCYVPVDYIEAVVKTGGIPVILPVINDEEIIKYQIESIDGLLVPGGVDVNSLIYGEEPQKKQGFIYDEVDRFDIEAIKTAYELRKPILGICRGIQVINVAFGGTLYQDIASVENFYIKHSQESRKELGTHTIDIKEGSILYNIFGKGTVTNSYHHQAVKDVAKGFEITAMSKDGVIEAIEKTDGGFVLGVQWHPEMMFKTHESMLSIFKVFIDEVRRTIE